MVSGGTNYHYLIGVPSCLLFAILLRYGSLVGYFQMAFHPERGFFAESMSFACIPRARKG